MTNRQHKSSGRVTRGDLRLLLSAALFLGAVMLQGFRRTVGGKCPHTDGECAKRRDFNG